MESEIESLNANTKKKKMDKDVCQIFTIRKLFTRLTCFCSPIRGLHHVCPQINKLTKTRMMIAGEAFILMNYDVVVKEKTMVFLSQNSRVFHGRF